MWKYISNFFSKIGQGFKSAIPILLIVLCVLIVTVIWWLGPMLQYQETKPLSSVLSRSVVSAIYILLCIAFWGFFQWKQLETYKAEQEHAKKIKDDPNLEYEDKQEAEFNQIIIDMKRNLSRPNYLYALPWYIVLGLENAGKTSLINRSDHKFVFSSAMRTTSRKRENKYGFDWWIGDDSVIIDPDGELLSQGKFSAEKENGDELSRRLWVHFIHWLVRTRSRRPLNGVIIAVDISLLASSKTLERQRYADLLRARLRELMETLSTRMPVYITLTKVDMLYGFEPFFRHLSKSQREEVLGFTFSLESVDDLDSWLTEFSQDYQRFLSRINDALPALLLEASGHTERCAIYSFTRQIAGLQEMLQDFFQDTLASDQFSTSALVRGIYFTSVFQQGVFTNALDYATSNRYQITPSVKWSQPDGNSTVYFAKSLLRRIVYPEAGMASDNFRVAKQKRRALMLLSIVCLIATAALVSSWHRYYKVNIEQANLVLEKVNTFRDINPEDLSLFNQKEILAPLDTIREATLEFGFFRQKSQYISDMGLYQGHVIGPKVELTYLALLESRFLPSLMKIVALDLSQAEDAEYQLGVLRVFRMLTDKSGRHNDFVLDYFSKHWQTQFTGNRQIQERLLGHLHYAMVHTDLASQYRQGVQSAMDTFEPYQALVSDTQSDLSAMPIEQRVYRNLKTSSSSYIGSPINLRNQIGPVFDVVFEERVMEPESLNISRMLTKKGFNSYFVGQSDSVSELALIDTWVLGQSEVAEFSAADKLVLQNKIWSQYVVDYTTTWRQVLNNIDVKYFTDINNAVLVLDNLTGSTRPIKRLLQILEENTRLFADFLENPELKEELLKTPEYKIASMIHSPFSNLNALLIERGEQPAYLDEVQVAMEQLLNYLKAILDAPNIGRAALDATHARVNLSNADPIYTLKRVALGLPSPLNDMVSKIADESWYVIKQEAIKHLEVRWKNDVYSVFNEKFASRYPFNQKSNKDVALEDFELFFSPGGTLDTFYEKQLKMFIEENISMEEKLEQQALIRPEVLNQFQQAKKIQQAFFNSKGVLDVSFSLEPVRLTSNKRRAVFNIDGQYVEYSHGPRTPIGLIWPNTLRTSSVSRITLVPSKSNVSPRSLEAKGPWAFFRLLNRSDIVGGSTTSLDYRFNIDNGKMSYRLYSESSVNPFKEQLFDSFKLSETLY